MKKWHVVTFLSALMIGFLAWGSSLSHSRAKPVTFDAAVKVITSGGHGSGVHVGNGYVVTAAHVVGDAKSVSLLSPDGRSYGANVLWASKEYDIAMLRTSASGIPAAKLDCGMVHMGDDVQLIGNPLFTDFVISYGKIAGNETINGLGGTKTTYVLNMAVVGGQSGGAIFHDGRVVGIAAMVMLAPTKIPNTELYSTTPVGFGFAVPSKVVCDLMGRKS